VARVWGREMATPRTFVTNGRSDVEAAAGDLHEGLLAVRRRSADLGWCPRARASDGAGSMTPSIGVAWRINARPSSACPVDTLRLGTAGGVLTDLFAALVADASLIKLSKARHRQSVRLIRRADGRGLVAGRPDRPPRRPHRRQAHSWASSRALDRTRGWRCGGPLWPLYLWWGRTREAAQGLVAGLFSC